MFKVPSAWRSVTVDGYVDPSGGNRVTIIEFYFSRSLVATKYVSANHLAIKSSKFGF